MRAIVSLLLLAIAGCVTTREVTISTRPSDAVISVDGVDRGRGPITEKFTYASDTDYHTVTATRVGYEPYVFRAGRDDFDQPTKTLELKLLTRHVAFTVTPVSGVVSIDGKPI